MHRALGARLALPGEGNDGAAVAVSQTVWRWAIEGLTTRMPHGRTTPLTTETWREADLAADGAAVRTIEASDGPACLRRTIASVVDDVDSSVVWRTTVDLMSVGDSVECSVEVEVGTSHPEVLPAPLQPRTISLLHALAAHGAFAGDQRTGTEAHAVVGRAGVDHLVDSVLLDEQRVLPVLLFTNVKEHDSRYPEHAGDPSLVARELCGIAHVHLIARTEDTHRLTKRIGALSAYDGAVRIYWPRMRLDDAPQLHPLHLRDRLHRSSMPAIVRRITDASARAFAPIDGARPMLARRRRDAELSRLDEVLSHTDSADRDQAMRAFLVEVMDEQVRLEEEIGALRGEIALLRNAADPVTVPGIAQQRSRPAATSS